MKKALLFILPLVLGSCAVFPSSNQPVVQAYSGPTLPANQVSRLYCARTLVIDSIDGNKAYNTHASSFFSGPGACNFALQPGLHILVVSYNNATTTATGTTYEDSDPFPVVVTTEAGKYYTLKPLLGSSSYGMRYSSIKVNLVELPAGTPFNAASALNPR